MDQRREHSISVDSLNSPVIYLIVVLLPAIYGFLYFSTIATEPAPHETRRYAITVPSGVPLSVLPPAVDVDRRRADLGKALFFDTVLSGDGDISCADCHDIAEGGDVSQSTGAGMSSVYDSRAVPLNAPTVFNVDLNMAQFWDGRSPTLESQIDDHIASTSAMASSWPEIIDKLLAHESYRERFQAEYKDGVTADNIKDAIASFERTLVTPNARFDQFLQGREDAIDDLEKEGYRLFTTIGCVVCHQGRNIGGNVYQKLGLIHPYETRGGDRPEDQGLFKATGAEADRQVFRVPSLRNVALTAPYLHDGSVPTLEAAVKLMAYHQLGRTLDQGDVKALVAFLRTLSGDVPS